MPLLHSARINTLLASEPGGTWIDRASTILWLVAKLPMYFIREIDNGAETRLNAWVVRTDDGTFALFGLGIHDDAPKPRWYFGACRTTAEINDLRELMGMKEFPVQIYNELRQPILNLTCSWEPERFSAVAAALPSGEYPVGDGIAMRRKASDIIIHCNEEVTVADPRIVAHSEVCLAVIRKQPIKVTVLGNGDVSLNEINQGEQQERLTYQLLEQLFESGVYHSPQRPETDGLEELCDVLALSRAPLSPDQGIFVFSSKVSTSDERRRRTERRGLTIQGNIEEAIGQAVGAIKRLKRGVQIFHKDGRKIEEENLQVTEKYGPLKLHERAQSGHGIVIVSDMSEGVDWQHIYKELIKARDEVRYPFQVFDLTELHAFVTNSHGKPHVFEYFLGERWKAMVKSEVANIRINFKFGTTPAQL